MRSPAGPGGCSHIADKEDFLEGGIREENIAVDWLEKTCIHIFRGTLGIWKREVKQSMLRSVAGMSI